MLLVCMCKVILLFAAILLPCGVVGRAIVLALDTLPDDVIPDLYQKYKEAFEDENNAESLRRVYNMNKEYKIHVKHLKEVNGFKKHNLLIREERKLDTPFIYVNNPVESKLPFTYLSLEEFKKILTDRVQREIVASTTRKRFQTYRKTILTRRRKNKFDKPTRTQTWIKDPMENTTDNYQAVKKVQKLKRISGKRKDMTKKSSTSQKVRQSVLKEEFYNTSTRHDVVIKGNVNNNEKVKNKTNAATLRDKVLTVTHSTVLDGTSNTTDIALSTVIYDLPFTNHSIITNLFQHTTTSLSTQDSTLEQTEITSSNTVEDNWTLKTDDTALPITVNHISQVYADGVDSTSSSDTVVAIETETNAITLENTNTYDTTTNKYEGYTIESRQKSTAEYVEETTTKSTRRTLGRPAVFMGSE